MEIKYLTGNEQEFLNFLNKINKKDKVAILTHNDLDGIASGIFMEDILNGKGINVEIIEFLSYNLNIFEKITPLLKQKKITYVFILDINIGDESYASEFEKLRKNFKVFLIDHHPFNRDLKNIIKSDSSDCVAWVIYNLGKKFNLFDYEKWKWLICSTMISEYSHRKEKNLKYLKSVYSKDNFINNYDEHKNGEIFNSEPGEITKMISYSLVYFRNNLRQVYDFVKNKNLLELEKYYGIINKEIQKNIEEYKKNAEFFPEKNILLGFLNSRYNVASIVASILAGIYYHKTILLGSDDEKFLKISFRNQSGNENVGLLAKKAIIGLKDATAGGHACASAARIMKKDLEKFKENILS